MPKRGWNHWYHIMISTYGQWLPGDERGWRTRHHRDHIEGDYQNPVYLARAYGLYGASKMRMPFAPVILLKRDCSIIGHLMLESLGIQNIELLALAVTMAHVHTLARCPDNNPRYVEGRAKQHATYHFRQYVASSKTRGAPKVVENPAMARESPWFGEEGRKLWALRGREKPIADRAHQLRVFHYVLDHE